MINLYVNNFDDNLKRYCIVEEDESDWGFFSDLNRVPKLMERSATSEEIETRNDALKSFTFACKVRSRQTLKEDFMREYPELFI